jgi:glycine dehydrogenase subunit 2
MTLEPSESYSRADLDEYADIIAEISREAHESPEAVTNSPQNSTVHKMDLEQYDDPQQWALTWRAHVRKRAAERASVGTRAPGS